MKLRFLHKSADDDFGASDQSHGEFPKPKLNYVGAKAGGFFQGKSHTLPFKTCPEIPPTPSSKHVYTFTLLCSEPLHYQGRRQSELKKKKYDFLHFANRLHPSLLLGDVSTPRTVWQRRAAVWIVALLPAEAPICQGLSPAIHRDPTSDERSITTRDMCQVYYVSGFIELMYFVVVCFNHGWFIKSGWARQ